jgi:hypothetical protein
MTGELYRYQTLPVAAVQRLSLEDEYAHFGFLYVRFSRVRLFPKTSNPSQVILANRIREDSNIQVNAQTYKSSVAILARLPFRMATPQKAASHHIAE